MRNEVNNLTGTSIKEKERLEKQVSNLEVSLKEKIAAEQNYQLKIKELEEMVENNAKNLSAELNVSLQNQTKEKAFKAELEKGIEEKNKRRRNFTIN